MAMDPRPQAPRPEERTNSLCELREALVIVAALVGQADGRIDPVEREPLIEAIERYRLPSIFSRAYIVDAFRSRVRRIAAGGRESALDELDWLAGTVAARPLSETAVRIATADGHLDVREREVLDLIQTALTSEGHSSWRRQGGAS